MSVAARDDSPVPLGPNDGSVKTNPARPFARSGNPLEAGSDALLRVVTNSLPVLISYVDASECYRFANDTYQVWHGSAPAEIIGRRMLDVLGAEAYAAVAPHVRRALAGEQVTYESNVRFRDGGWRTIRATYVPDISPAGEVRGFVALVEDNSAQARAAERSARLQAVSAALSGALGPVEVGQVVVDQIRPLLGANLGVVAAISDDGREFITLRAVGYPADVTEGLATVPVDAPSMFREVVRRREAIFVESGAERAAKYPYFGKIPVEGGNGAAAAMPLLFEGRPIGAIGFGFPDDRPFTPGERDLLLTIADLSAQALERARLHAVESASREAMEAAIRLRDEFLASASHDLKSPLTVIKGRAQLAEVHAARLGSPAGDRIAEAMATVQSAADAMGGQIDELLDVSLMRVGQQLPLDIQPIDLVALVRDEVNRWRPQVPAHTVRFVAEVAEQSVHIDAARLRRVLWNLLGNAAKYSPGGGEIAVTVAAEAGDRPEQLGWAVIHVEDHGIGIPEADLTRIFERFHRAANAFGRAKGTGLGLSGVKHIVELHGGSVCAKSVEGAGSTFTVRLPLGQWTTDS
jgi:PAS domain S-box-containing protein